MNAPATTIERAAKERPILFSGPMVRAILDGRKTQTRRVVDRDSVVIGPAPGMYLDAGQSAWYVGRGKWSVSGTEAPPEFVRRCPFGAPGDRLWVRETWGLFDRERFGGEAGYGVAWRATHPEPSDGLEWIDGPEDPSGDRKRWPASERWRPSIHMPRWASRITLEVTGVRVERLQTISEADAQAEGVACGDGSYRCDGDGASYLADKSGWYVNHRRHNAPSHAFAALWDLINGAGSWASNPWVWVVSFRRVEGGR